MDYQQFLISVSDMVNMLNVQLASVSQVIQSKLSLKTDSLPAALQMPLGFVGMLALLMMIIVGFANNFICNAFGILYPLMYGVMLSTSPSDTKLATLNKYWMLFGAMTLIDSTLGFVLNFIPGYHYMKIGLLYLMIRNDFSFSGTLFDLVTSFYAKSPYREQVEQIVNNVEQKLNTQKVDTVIETDASVAEKHTKTE